MSDEKSVSVKMSLPAGAGAAHEIAASGALRSGLEVTDHEQLTVKLQEIQQVLYIARGTGNRDAAMQVARALELYESLEPADAAEGMLATQMVGTHFAALECLRRANLPDQTFAGRDMSLKHAQKLMTLYARQLETLKQAPRQGASSKVTARHVPCRGGRTGHRSALSDAKREPRQSHGPAPPSRITTAVPARPCPRPRKVRPRPDRPDVPST